MTTRDISSFFQQHKKHRYADVITQINESHSIRLNPISNDLAKQKYKLNIPLTERTPYNEIMQQVLNHLTSPMLPVEILTDDIRYGIYGVALSYNLGMRTISHGAWSWIELYDKETSFALRASDIIKRNFDENGFRKAAHEYYNDYHIINLSSFQCSAQKSDPEYGWLSPNGEFIKGEFGDHEELASKIIDNNFASEYVDYLLDDANQKSLMRGDFLVKCKHYVLIHNPSLMKIICNLPDRLTKSQKEFLYDYFMNINDSEQAASFLNA